MIFRVDPVTGGRTVVSAGGLLVSPVGVAIAEDGGGPFGPGTVIRVDCVTGAQSVISTGGVLGHITGIAIDRAGNYVIANEQGGAGSDVVRVDAETGAECRRSVRLSNRPRDREAQGEATQVASP